MERQLRLILDVGRMAGRRVYPLLVETGPDSASDKDQGEGGESEFQDDGPGAGTPVS